MIDVYYNIYITNGVAMHDMSFVVEQGVSFAASPSRLCSKHLGPEESLKSVRKEGVCLCSGENDIPYCNHAI
jgi:hypothetical protein